MKVSLSSSSHTMNSLLEKTKSYMGGDFFSYSGSHNNCQIFIDSILKSNSLSSLENSKFILQDTRHLFSNNPRFRKLSNTVTDIAAIKHRVDDLGYNPIRGLGNHLLHLRPVTAPYSAFVLQRHRSPNNLQLFLPSSLHLHR